MEQGVVTSRHRPWLLLAIIRIIGPLLVMCWLIEELGTRGPMWGDEVLLQLLRARDVPRDDRLMIIVSGIGSPWLMLRVSFLLVLPLALRSRWMMATFVGLTMIGAAGLTAVLKLLLQRARPALAEVPIPDGDYSFPSGHATLSMATVLMLLVLLWSSRWRRLLVPIGGLFVLAVAISRVSLSAHYPSDILAGWSLGFSWVAIVHLLVYGVQWKGLHVVSPPQVAVSRTDEVDSEG